MLDYLPYILLFVILFVASLLEISGIRNDQMKFVRWFVLTFLLFFVGLRYNTGADWSIYTAVFKNFPIYGNYVNWEPGFYWLMKLIYNLFGNYYVLQFLVTFFLLYAINRFFTKNSKYPIFCISIFVIIFLTTIMMAQVRQSIALSIVLLGTPYIFKRDIFKYILVIFIASLFHISSVVALLLYFLYYRSSKSVLIFILLLAQSFIIFPSIIIDIINFISHLFPERLETLVNIYTNNLYSDDAEFGTGLFYIISVVFCIFVIIYSKNEKNEDNFFLNILVVTYVVIALSKSMVILGRFQSYFYVYAILAMVNLLDLKIKNFTMYIGKLVWLLVLFVIMQYPLIIFLKSKEVDKYSGICVSCNYVPYYNVLNYPEEANARTEE